MTGCNKLILIFQIKLCRYISKKFNIVSTFFSHILSTYPLTTNRRAYCKIFTK